MALLHYGSRVTVEIPDRDLAHLKVVVATKLRRGESFLLTIRSAPGSAGDTALWVHPAIPLRFTFSSVEPELLDHDHLRRLADAASSSRGLTIVLDPPAPVPAVASREFAAAVA